VKVLIATSKEWFDLDKKILKSNKVQFIYKKKYLTKNNIDKFSPNIIFFPNWNWMIPKEIYENFICIVFHTSPLPYGRGGSPIQNLILKNYKKAPVCAIKVTKVLDAGPIYTKKIVSLNGSLSVILERINKAINHMIQKIILKNPIPHKQKGKINIFRRRNHSDNRIPKNINLNKIYDYIRMLDHKEYPNAYIHYGKFTLEFTEAKLSKNNLKVKCIIKKNDNSKSNNS
tara:strand:+ start:23948 stop:24634 length:687 start_codon:yes stop_codon:yes gene_type:complete